MARAHKPARPPARPCKHTWAPATALRWRLCAPSSRCRRVARSAAPAELYGRCLKKVEDQYAVFETDVPDDTGSGTSSVGLTDGGLRDPFEAPQTHTPAKPEPENIHEVSAGKPLVVHAEQVDPHVLSREILEDIIESAVTKSLEKVTAPPHTPAGSSSFGSAGAVLTFGDEYVPELKLVEKGTLLIDSDCGLGKTTQLVKACQRLRAQNPHARIVAVSSRKSHAQDLAKDLEDGGLDPWCYLDHAAYYQHRLDRSAPGEDISGVSYVDHPCVVISLEHMADLRFCGPCDLQILDESRSLADKTKEQTTVKSMDCFDELQRQYRMARYVVSADADCRIDNAMKHLHGMDSARQVETWHVPFKRMKRTVHVSYKPGTKQYVPAQFLNAIHTLTSKGKIGVATSTRKMAKQVRGCLPPGGRDVQGLPRQVRRASQACRFQGPGCRVEGL